MDSIVIATDGPQSAVEQARTALENAHAYPSLGTPLTLGEVSAQLTGISNAYQQLVDVVAVLSIGVGFVGAAMFATVRLEHPLVAPGAAYYLITAAGTAVSLGVIASAFPLLRRITGPEAARNE